MIVNKREIIYHESTVCDYRKVKCHNCAKIEQDVEKMKEKLEGMKIKVEKMAEQIEVIDKKMEEKIQRVDEKIVAMNDKMEYMAADVGKIKTLVVQIFEKVHFIENGIQISPPISYVSNSTVEDILIAGGWDSDSNTLKSVERFSWEKNVWERVSSMNVGRKGATSFVYENQEFVAGGCDSPVVEALNLNEDPLQWKIFEATISFICSRLCSIVYQNRAVLFCACSKTGNVAELSLTPPYTCKQLCKMPEPERKTFTVVAFQDRVLIFGGSSVSSDNFLDSVLQFDLRTSELKAMPSLPCAMSNMAGARWEDQAVLVGGYGNGEYSKTVLMYDAKSGNTTELPFLLEGRSSCAVVITGNTIVVMGGKGESGRVRSVEAFTLGGYSWRYLPAMNDIRSVATATVLPTKKVH